MDKITNSYDGKIQMIDSTSVRLHQQAVAIKKGARHFSIGRSRGGLTTKLHLRIVGNGLPVHFELTPASQNDAPMVKMHLNDLPNSKSLG